MVNPDRAWNKVGLSVYCEVAIELADIKETNPGMALGRAFRYGFKAGIEAANRIFSKELKPENRQN